MSFGTRVHYGFKVSNNFSDVIDTELALERLKLNIGDLNIIRGADDAGAVRSDLIAVSGLNVPLYKTLDRYQSETEIYKSVMENSGGADAALRGDLDINGPLAASGIRYKFLNPDTESIGIADISTSRISAWSTASSTPIASDPIFYGSQIEIASNGGGVGGTITANKLTWGEIAQPKIFAAELPTHKITTTINGTQVKLYAMKSIPLKFDGYFRNFDGAVTVNAISGVSVGWRIINQVNSTDESRFERNALNYRSVVGAPRRVELYYPPDRFTSISLPALGMFTLPKAELPNLTNLNIALNEFRDIPDITTFAPTLTTLNIYRNNLYLAQNPSLRKLGLDSINKFPSSITSINMYGTYYGSIRCVDRSEQNGTGVIVGPEITTGIGESDSDGPISMSVIEARFPDLVTLNVQRGSGPYFGPDEYDPLCYLPSAPDTCENYFAAYNDFRGIPTTGLKDLTNLKNLNLYSNYYLSDANFSLTSFDLVSVNIGYTQLSIPDLSSRTLLTSFDNRYGRRINPLYAGSTDASYKFSNCSTLASLGFYGSYANGFIPKFKGNFNLTSVDFYAAQYMTGGRPDNGEHGYAEGDTYVMYKDTFNDAKGMRFFRVLSSRLLVGKGFEPGTFKNLSNLYYLYWYSYGRTGLNAVVELPDISSCPALQYMIMHNNNFSGSVPSFVSNNVIYYVDLSSNNLVGGVPVFANKTRLRYVFLNNNQLSSFTGFENTTSLNYAYLHNNQIAGDIPMLSGQAPNLYRLYLYNNELSGYTVGSFAGLTRIQIIDISNNDLYASDINNIVDDLYSNYLTTPRAGVSVNLRSQSNAVGYAPSSLGSVREQEVREKLDFLASKGWSVAIGG
jgi:Leucine-rich repeat (LRR) protein